MEDLEKQQEFVALVQVTEEEYSESIDGLGIVLRDAGHEVKNFFRRSRLSLDTWDGKPIRLDPIARSYRRAFEPGEVTTTYPAPLEGVEFAQNKMDFGDFRIQRFDHPHELDPILEGRVCRVFYPWAAIDADELRWHWLLVVSDSGSKASAPDSDLTGVRVSYSPFPEALTRSLRSLYLFPWCSASNANIELGVSKSARDPWAGPQHFRVPFYLTASNSLMATPPVAANLSALEWKEPDESGHGGGPSCWLRLDDHQTQEFCDFIREAVKSLNDVVDNGPPKWGFMSVGLNFFVKGCLAGGLESLLWYITAIEALAGENKRELKKLVARRVGGILSPAKRDRENVEEKFYELWHLRCELVHGKTALESRKTFHGHLGEANEMSRQVTLWMLRQLHEHIRAAPSKLPARDQLLADLDG